MGQGRVAPTERRAALTRAIAPAQSGSERRSTSRLELTRPEVEKARIVQNFRWRDNGVTGTDVDL